MEHVKSSGGSDLGGFIRSAKEHGADDAFIVALLRQNGWSVKGRSGKQRR